jgi:hypothetical protein
MLDFNTTVGHVLVNVASIEAHHAGVGALRRKIQMADIR